MLDKVKGKYGGWLARFPKAVVPMHSRWQGILEYLMEVQPNNKQAIRKATKMMNRG